MKRSTILILATTLTLLGAGCSLTTTVERPVKQTKQTNTNTAISYPGQDGKNALELLQSTHHVDVSAQGFVSAIDGIKPGDHEFWAFYVNTTQANVGAKEYQTKTSDAITWKLEGF